MQLHEFYEHTLPPTGNYTIFRSSTREHFWCESLDELVELTEHYADVTDCYFATATFSDAGSRKQANVSGLKSFRLDLDAGEKKLATQGPDKVYASQQDAIAAIVAFSKETGLVPSLIVSSGEGLHIYYELDKVVRGDVWTKVAKAFQRFGATKLKIDSTVTADSARVLRPIGTLHPNGKRVSVLKFTGKVYSLAEFSTIVGDKEEDDDWAAGANFGDDAASINDEAVVQGPPKDMEKILKRCANVRWAYENQAQVEEPYWRGMIGITKHVIDGSDWAHKISKDHPEYNRRRTQEKFDRYEAGPTTCERLCEFNKSACSGCEHKGKIKSPISLGSMSTDEVEKLPEELKPKTPEPKKSGNVWDGFIPKGFDVINFRGAQTLVHYMDIEKENDLGDTITVRVTVPVTHEIFWLGHWSDAEGNVNTAKATGFRLDQSGIVNEFTMDQAIVASNAELAKFLAGQGIHTASDKRSLTAMVQYIKSSLQRVKMGKARPRVSDHFGLRNLRDGRLVSAHGRYVIYPDGKIGLSILSPALESVADGFPLPLPPSTYGEWDATVWKEHIMPHARRHVEFMRKYYRHKGLEKYQLAMMMSMASPFMAYATGTFMSGSTLPPNGLTVSLYSRESARGKSSVMHCATLAYGVPSILCRDQNKIAATDLARTATLSMSGTMPAFMDEMGSTDPKSIAGLVSAIGNGASRIRLSNSGVLVGSSPWALIATLATNRSQRDMVAAGQEESSAIQYRLLELDVDNMPEFNADVRSSFERDWKALHECAGALGAVIQLVMSKKGSAWVSELMSENLREASRHVSVDNQSARFQYRGLAAALALHAILDSVGLAPFDRRNLIEEFRIAHDSGREYIDENVSTSDTLDMLAKCLFDLAPNTVVTMTHTHRSKSSVMYDSALNRVPEQVKARHIVNQAVTYVSSDALRKWATDKHMRLSELIGAAKSRGVLRRIYNSASGTDNKTVGKQWSAKFNLMAGMKESTGSYINCYCFNTAELAKATGGDHHKDLVETLKANVVSLPAPKEDAA